VRAVHVVLAGDDSLPALAVPQFSRVSMPEPSATGLTMGGGVAASVRSAQTELSPNAKKRSHATLLLLGLSGLCALGFVATRFLHGEAKRAAYVEANRAGAASEPAAPLQREAAVSVVSVAGVAPTGPASPVLPLPVLESPPKAAHPAAPRAVSGGALAKPKPHAAKVAIDPFLKRH